MRYVAIAGAGMTKFGKFLDRSMKDIAAEAVRGALESAGVAVCATPNSVAEALKAALG